MGALMELLKIRRIPFALPLMEWESLIAILYRQVCLGGEMKKIKLGILTKKIIAKLPRVCLIACLLSKLIRHPRLAS